MGSSLFPQQIVKQQTGMSQASPALINTMVNPAMPVQSQPNQNKDQILQLWNTVKNSSNSQQAFEQILNNNPQLKSTYEMVKSMGDPKQLFYTLAQKQGTDPNQIINLLNGGTQ